MGNEWRRWVKLTGLTRLSSETSSKCSGIDLDGLWSISAKEKPGRRYHLTCLEVDQLLERRTSPIPGILLELGVAVLGLCGTIEGWCGYGPAKARAPEEHAPPDGRDRGAFGRWEAQRSKLDYAAHPLPWDSRTRDAGRTDAMIRRTKRTSSDVERYKRVSGSR